jgi:uncharacterized repeat protein (TIGR01451 family)
VLRSVKLRRAVFVGVLCSGAFVVASPGVAAAKNGVPGPGHSGKKGSGSAVSTVGAGGASSAGASVGSEFEPGSVVTPGDHVPICHAIGNGGFVAIAPSAGVVFGHAGSSHQDGRDVIPPFTYQPNSGAPNTSLAGGQNWNAQGQSLLASGCVGQAPPPPPPPKPPPGSSTPPAPSGTPAVDTSIAKTVDPAQATVGQTVTWHITVTNNAASRATNVVVTDLLRPGVAFVSAVASQGSCDLTVCRLGTLAGGGGTATITIVTNAVDPGTAINSAAVGQSEIDYNESNNTTTAKTEITSPPFLPPAARRCGRLVGGTKTRQAGAPTTIWVEVRDSNGKTMKGVRVVARGVGVHASARSNRYGIVRINVTARGAGVITLRVAGASRCTGKVGITDVFQPPVTG